MPEIECDNCERSFETAPGEAGSKVRCPFCGDVNRVPGEPPAAPDLPPDAGPEQEIRRLHPAMARAHPFRFLVIAILGIGGLGLAAWSAASDRVPAWLVWPGLLMIAAAAGWWLAWFIGACLWVKLTISNKRTTRHEGIVRRNTSEVLHDHVRNIEIRQNFVQRILNVGYLGISSSGQDDIEIEVRDVPNPYEIKELIDRYRDM